MGHMAERWLLYKMHIDTSWSIELKGKLMSIVKLTISYFYRLLSRITQFIFRLLDHFRKV